MKNKSGYMKKCKRCPRENYCQAVTRILITVLLLEKMHKEICKIKR